MVERFLGQGFDCTVDFNHKTKLGPNWTKIDSGQDRTKVKSGPKANQIQSYGQIAIIIHENDQYLQVADQCNSQFEIVSGKSRNKSNLVGRPRTTRMDTDNYKFDFHSG